MDSIFVIKRAIIVFYFVFKIGNGENIIMVVNNGYCIMRQIYRQKRVIIV